MFEMEINTIEKARERHNSFSMKAFVEKMTKDLTTMLSQDVHMPVVSEVKRYSITANCSTAEAIKHIAEKQAEERQDREDKKFQSTIDAMVKQFEGVKEQNSQMQKELGLEFAYGSKCKDIGSDGFGQIEQIISEYQLFSSLLPFKSVIYNIEVRAGCKTFRKIQEA